MNKIRLKLILIYLKLLESDLLNLYLIKDDDIMVLVNIA